MSSPLEAYLTRPISQPDPAVARAIGDGPMDPRDAMLRTDVDRLLDPAPLAVENGWCTLPDGVGYVAIRTAMPDVTGPMVDWWFDWHPREAIRYRIWHPEAHADNRVDPPAVPGAKAHWGTVHHPTEDVGVGMVRARIAFCHPTDIGFSTNALHDTRVATIACGWAGDETRHMRHTPMIHVFLNEGDGVVLRSRFWLGAAMRPYLPGPLAAAGEWALNRPAVRRRALPAGLPRALAHHCAEEYANLGTLLPELYASYGPGAAGA